MQSFHFCQAGNFPTSTFAKQTSLRRNIIFLQGEQSSTKQKSTEPKFRAFRFVVMPRDIPGGCHLQS